LCGRTRSRIGRGRSIAARRRSPRSRIGSGRSNPFRNLLVGGIGARHGVDVGSRRNRGGRQRIHVAAVLLHGELHLARIAALETGEERVALVGHLRSQARRLVLFQHVDIEHTSRGVEPYHHADHAAETVLARRLHGIAHDRLARTCRMHRNGQFVERQLRRLGPVERRQHGAQRGLGRSSLGLGDRPDGNHIDIAYPRRRDERDREEHGYHVHKCTFHRRPPTFWRRNAWV